MKNIFYTPLICLLLTTTSCQSQAHGPEIKSPKSINYSFEIIAEGIDIPWGLSFTGKDSFLVTDKKGILYHVENGDKTIVEGIPNIVLSRQGGLLDVAVDNNFEINNLNFDTIGLFLFFINEFNPTCKAHNNGDKAIQNALF